MIEAVKLMYEHPFITIGFIIACGVALNAFTPIVIVKQLELKKDKDNNDT